MSSIRLSLFPRWCGVVGLVVALILPPSAEGRIPGVQPSGTTGRGAAVAAVRQDAPPPTPAPGGEPRAGERAGALFLPLVSGAMASPLPDAGLLVRPAAAPPTPTPSGAFAPYPQNPGLNTQWERIGTPPANAAFDAAGAATGSPPANADFSAAAYGSGDPPTNYDFASGTLEGWSTAGTVTLDSDAVHGAFARLASGGVLTTAPFTVTAEAQQLWVEIGYLHATSTSYVEVYVVRGANFATETKLRTLYCQNCGWQSAAFDLTPYGGEAVKFKFKRTGGTIGIDTVWPVVALSGYTTSGSVGREVGADNQVYASASSGAALVSAPFTVTVESQYTLVRLAGLSASTDQVQLFVLSGAAYTTSTQVAATSIGDAWGDLRLALAAWQGQAIRLKVTCSYGKLGVDDVARQIVELPGWTVSGDSRRVEDGQGGVYVSTDSVLVSSPFTLATGLQQLTVRHRRESGSGQSFYISLLRGSNFGEEVGPLAGVPVTTTTWQTATIDVGVYAGEVVRLKLRASANRVQFDDAGFGERLLPGWQTVNAGFGAITAGKDAAGTYLTSPTAGGAFTLQSAPFSPGLSGGGGYGRYYTVAYDIGYGAGSLIRIWWVDQATQQSYVVFQDGADTPTGYRLRYAGLPASFGATGVFQVHVTGGGKLYSVGLDAVRQQQNEPYALEAGAGIDTVTGSFHVSQEDVRIDGAFPIPFVRTVHSHLDQPGVLGYGWSHLYAAHLAFSQVGDVSVVLGSGQEHFFRSQQGGTFAPEDSRVQTLLARNSDSSYTYTTSTGLRYGFDAGGRLLALTDAGENTLTLGYTGELLSTVSGAAGGLAFGYDAANRLATLSASTGVTVSYQYDGDELVGVVRSDGHTTQYSYDARHHLTSRVENGATLTSQRYDDVGRVVTQSVTGGQSLSIAYASPAQGVTAVTNAQGAATHYYHDRFGRTTQVLTPDGQLTTYVYDAAGNLLEVQHTGNQPPTVSVSAAPTSGSAPLAVSFAAVGSDADGDTLSYRWDFGDGGAAGNTAQANHLYAQGGHYTATVTVSDGLATASAQAGIVINRLPVVSLSATPASGSAPLDVTLTATASDGDGDALAYSWSFGDGGAAGDAASVLHRYEQSGVYTATVSVSDGKTSVSSQQVIVVAGAAVVLAPDPIDPSIPTTLFDSTDFLYSGANPVQSGVVSGTIEPVRAAVVRGHIVQPDGAGLAGVQVTVRGRPELGMTSSRADGGYDLAVNGGGALTLDVSKPGYLPAQRTVEVPWQRFVVMEAMVLTPLDAAVSTIDLSAATPIQVARGGVVSDTDGVRQATLLVPQGVQAEMVMPDGATQPLTTLHVRATEYTVGERGAQAMPGELPAQSGYTYAVELSVDEALAAGAAEVRFDRPIYVYVENFLGFGVGMNVPAGYYDRNRSSWIAAPDGRVVQIVGVVDGLAQIDSNGDGVADDGPTPGFSTAERQTLTALYAVGQTLWRVPLMHLTPWDFNWPYRLPGDAVAPPGAPLGQARPLDSPCTVSGSILECENQILGERVGLVGTPHTFNYRSDRVEGYDGGSFTVPLSGGAPRRAWRALSCACAWRARNLCRALRRSPISTTPTPGTGWTPMPAPCRAARRSRWRWPMCTPASTPNRRRAR